MKKIKALIVVDVQNDFCPGGSLAVPDGDMIIERINKLLPKFDLVIFTKDWHNEHMDAFASSYEGAKPGEKFMNDQLETDILWPDHCVENTPGADLHPNLDLGKCKKDFYIFKKGNNPHYHPYSAFGEKSDDGSKVSELKKFLDERGVTDTYICGLAGDFCCKETAIDSALVGYDTYFIKDLIKFIGGENETLELLNEAGVICADSWALGFLGNI